jgi:hypothetical protein
MQLLQKGKERKKVSKKQKTQSLKTAKTKKKVTSFHFAVHRREKRPLDPAETG